MSGSRSGGALEAVGEKHQRLSHQLLGGRVQGARPQELGHEGAPQGGLRPAAHHHCLPVPQGGRRHRCTPPAPPPSPLPDRTWGTCLLCRAHGCCEAPLESNQHEHDFKLACLFGLKEPDRQRELKSDCVRRRG